MVTKKRCPYRTIAVLNSCVGVNSRAGSARNRFAPPLYPFVFRGVASTFQKSIDIFFRGQIMEGGKRRPGGGCMMERRSERMKKLLCIVLTAMLLAAAASAFAEGAKPLSAEMDARLHAELQARIDEILATQTQIVKSDEWIPGQTYTGTAYYVSPNGNDEWDGLTPETPKQSLKWVMAVSRGKFEQILEPGDAVFFERGGVYRYDLKNTQGRFSVLLRHHHSAGQLDNRYLLCNCEKICDEAIRTQRTVPMCSPATACAGGCAPPTTTITSGLSAPPAATATSTSPTRPGW